MSTDFNIAAADIAWDQIFPAEIVGVELYGPEEATSDKVSLGETKGHAYKGDPVTQNTKRGREVPLGWKVTTEFEGLVTGSNMRTAVANLINKGCNTIFTLINGAKLSFTRDQFSLAMGEELGQAFEGEEAAWKFKFRGKGTLLKSEFNSIYTAAP